MKRSLNRGYLRSWQRISELIRAGKSWSGREANCVFLNTGGPRFANVSSISGMDFLDDARAIALTDWDGDGRQDAWITNRTAPRLRLMRNVAPEPGHYLAVQLQGTTCNRDAVGARVELYTDDPRAAPHVRTVRAGSGFLAQSSRTLHFGLGNAARVERLVVRWPDGQVETITDLAVDRRYRVRQGAGRAEAWDASPIGLPRIADPLVPPDAGDATRVVMLRPRTTSALPAADVSDPQPRRPRLVTCWATWCQPCLVELAELGEAESRIRAAGLDVLALQVVKEEEEEVSEGATLLEQMAFPFATDIASPQKIAQLDRLFAHRLQAHRRFAVPTSLLLDAEGRLAVVYKGPVDVDQVLADVEQLGSADPLPYAGRWHRNPLSE